LNCDIEFILCYNNRYDTMHAVSA